jgi:hypothetical protein
MHSSSSCRLTAAPTSAIGFRNDEIETKSLERDRFFLNRMWIERSRYRGVDGEVA